MREFFWSGAHIAWPLFFVVVLTALMVIGMDYCWRVVRIRSAYLALVGAALWLVGTVLIIAVGT